MSFSAIRTAVAAIAAVSVISGALVASELVGSPSARAKSATTATAASFAARWWPDEVSPVSRRAPAMADSELTFTKGYSQRMAVRQAQLAEATPVLRPFGRSAAVAPRETHRLAARISDARMDRPGLN